MRARAEEGTVQQVIRPVESLFENLRAVQVSPAQSVRFQNGGALFTARVPGCPKEDACRCRVYGPDRRFLGLGAVHAQEGLLTVLRLFPGE
ncbi:MAG: tRNA pseudouridine(55) synthase TruB [Acutalibacteraceae bacterium]